MKILKTSDKNFSKTWETLLKRSSETPQKIEKLVSHVLHDVRRNGDEALRRYTKKFEGHTPRNFEVSTTEIRKAERQVGRAELASLKLAAVRIRRFHELQLKSLGRSWRIRKNGEILGEQILPIDRAGIYVPGGLAAYPSTVLMNTIPAKVAGVREVIMVSPWSGGRVNPYTLVAAKLAGVDRIFKLGGAQAIAALAYGTKSIPTVDKIVGPGNIFVATAKRLVFGQVGIDSVAGPTEIVVVADDSANADYVASDLLSQAEHDPLASPILVTNSEKLVSGVSVALMRQLASLERGAILEKALRGQGLVILTRHTRESLSIANDLAAEHLSLQIRSASQAASKIQNAGAIFIGPFSPVAYGDYIAGPNHVLPTLRNARFSSPLSVFDFVKRSSVLEFSKKSFTKLAPHVIRLARLEGLTAHAASVEIRLNRRPNKFGG